MSSTSWSPTTLQSVCETLALDDTGLLRRIRVEGIVPAGPGGAREVTLLAKAVAEQFDVGTWLAYDDGIITITFERRGVTRRIGD